MKTVILNQVSKSYGKIKAVENLNLNVCSGEIYGFIGPNGAGKSTTIRMILNFLQPDSGEISVLGFNPITEAEKIKKITGYVSSDTFMYNDMKVSELFRFSEWFHKIKVPERIKKLVEILDIDTNKRFEQLSFGNRKKISIACALIHSPSLIILDEPSNGLDPVIRINLYELLKEEQNNGSTIFFSSHVLSEVQKFCTRIGLIKDGKLIRETAAEDFTDVGYRLIRIESDESIDFSELNGIEGLEKNNKSIQFMYSGNPNQLLKLLGNYTIKSIHIEEPELESVFMHYFK